LNDVSLNQIKRINNISDQTNARISRSDIFTHRHRHIK